jgi:hypothetical protein
MLGTAYRVPLYSRCLERLRSTMPAMVDRLYDVMLKCITS